jgi:ribulose-bisphosphate carboxylase large chain
VIRATYELDPPQAAETLALIESVGRADGPDHVRARVVAQDAGRAVLEFPASNWGGDVTLLVSSLFAGEWADSSAFARCRLVAVELPAGLLPGPAFPAPDEVLVGAIVKPSLGLAPAEVAAVASALAAGGAHLIKDDELLGDPPGARSRNVCARSRRFFRTAFATPRTSPARWSHCSRGRVAQSSSAPAR